MILITGGLGFIGSHTVQALLDAGEECVLVQRSHGEVPTGRFDAPVALEQADATDTSRRYSPSGGDIASPASFTSPARCPGRQAPSRRCKRRTVRSAACSTSCKPHRGVGATVARRPGEAQSASTVAPATPFKGPLTEDMPLSMSAPHLIPTFKKVSELLGGHLADATGIEVVNLRISGTWGPLGHNPDPFFPAPSSSTQRHTAARRTSRGSAAGCMPRTRSISATSRTPAGRSRCCSSPTTSTTAPTMSPPASPRQTPRSPPRSGKSSRCPGRDLPSGGEARQARLDLTRPLSEATGYEPVWDTERAACRLHRLAAGRQPALNREIRA